jgi:hypothetical protein
MAVKTGPPRLLRRFHTNGEDVNSLANKKNTYLLVLTSLFLSACFLPLASHQSPLSTHILAFIEIRGENNSFDTIDDKMSHEQPWKEKNTFHFCNAIISFLPAVL